MLLRPNWKIFKKFTITYLPEMKLLKHKTLFP